MLDAVDSSGRSHITAISWGAAGNSLYAATGAGDLYAADTRMVRANVEFFLCSLCIVFTLLFAHRIEFGLNSQATLHRVLVHLMYPAKRTLQAAHPTIISYPGQPTEVYCYGTQKLLRVSSLLQ